MGNVEEEEYRMDVYTQALCVHPCFLYTYIEVGMNKVAYFFNLL